MSDGSAGAGIALTNLDEDPRPELILMTANNPGGSFQIDDFRYRVGYNIDAATGLPTSWLPSFSGYYTVPGITDQTTGAGIAVTNLDADPRPDMILQSIWTPTDGRSKVIFYKVAYNLQANGLPLSVGSRISHGSTDAGISGAGIAVTNLDDDPTPDMFIMVYENFAPDRFRYHVAYNLQPNGTSLSSGPHHYLTGPTHIATSAGATVASLDANSRPELVLWAMDAPSGHDQFRWRIGYNVSSSGFTSDWRPSPYSSTPGFGHESQGSGFLIHDINGNGFKDVLLMYYDNPSGANSFRYSVLWDQY
jgi:hypothetical protein